MKNLTLFSLVLLLVLGLSSCNSDDDSNEYNPCNNYSQIEEVTISDVELSIEQEDENYYYIINATILNNTEEKVFGETVFVLNIFDDNVLKGTLNCYEILPNETCNLNYIGRIPEGAEVDWDITLECIYYVLY